MIRTSTINAILLEGLGKNEIYKEGFFRFYSGMSTMRNSSMEDRIITGEVYFIVKQR